MSKDNSSCYLDADFLVAVLVPNHKYAAKSAKLFADLLAEKKKLCLSCLTLDEVWHSTWETLQDQVPKDKRKPHAVFYEQLNSILQTILTTPLMKIIQFEKDLNAGCISALENIKNYELRPRDAFHYAYMQDSGVNCIVTHDKHFGAKKIPGLIVRTI